MDRETFDVMWKMSAPDSPTQHLFMRIPQTELYTESLAEPLVLDVMPDVSSFSGEGARLLGLTALNVPLVQGHPTRIPTLVDLQGRTAVHDCLHRHAQLPQLAVRNLCVHRWGVHPRVGAAHPAGRRRGVRPRTTGPSRCDSRMCGNWREDVGWCGG